jgi:hypothetical protein
MRNRMAMRDGRVIEDGFAHGVLHRSCTGNSPVVTTARNSGIMRSVSSTVNLEQRVQAAIEVHRDELRQLVQRAVDAELE